jgi:hypothetical protein
MTSPRHILSTFDIKATSARVGVKPDELMINWTSLPAGSTASLYLPSVTADDILKTAAGLYGSQPFTRLDGHTIGCKAQGIAYVPIPPAPGNLAGLIDVKLPASIQRGDKLTVAVNQLTTQSARIPVSGSANGNRIPQTAIDRNPDKTIAWRKVAGTFKLALKVKTREEALPIIEHNLSILGWIFESIPPNSRWYPIFERYLGAVAGQVSGLGGKPVTVLPSGTGLWPGGPGFHGGLGGGSKPGTGHGSSPGSAGGHGNYQLVGKIEGLIFDHFGDFEGFVLETETDERFHFYSREKNLKDVVERAWDARLRVTVIPEDKNERHPRRIVLHHTPYPL